MTESKNAPPDNVIALSRYRAQIGRGKKLRRSEALMDSPNPEAAIRALPGDELYYVVHEAGPRDAMEILVYASANQVQAVADFSIWERDTVAPARLAEWLEIIAEAPYEKIGEWIAGMDVELVGLLLAKTTTIYDLSDGEPPDEPQGTFYPTPDRLFVLDVRGVRDEEADGAEGNAHLDPHTDPDAEVEVDVADSAASIIRIIDNLYRSDRALARRLLVAARGELPSSLEEMAYKWRSGRMADLGFADPWEALEVYRELDPASVHIGEGTGAAARVRPLLADAKSGDALRAPLALIDRLGGASPFSRAVAALSSADEVAELHFALVALSNRVLSADRVTPGDDEAVAAVLGRMLTTLDIAVELLAHGDDALAVEAIRTVAVMRLFRLGVSLIGKVRRLARTLERRGPFAALGPGLFEENDAEVIAVVTRVRPDFPRILDDPPRTGDRPFASMADIARATDALKEAAAAQAMLYALGIRAEHIGADAVTTSPGGGLELRDAATVDAGVLARTALVARLLADDSSPRRDPSMPFRPLSTDEVREFETLTRVQASDKAPPPMKLNEKLSRKVKAILDAVAPEALAAAARKVADRWVAGLVPLEPVLVRRPASKPTRRRR